MPAGGERSPRRVLGLGVVLLALLWLWTAPGLVSSNDGSHLALSRAQVLRGETTLGDEVALTLWVDRARREGRSYSDRPPGTAWLAAPMVWLGARLDPWLLQTSAEAKEIIVTPAATRYAQTYVARVRRMKVHAPPLVALQGTVAMVAVYGALVGALGLLGVVVLLRRRGVSPRGQAFAGLALGAASLWGPYAGVLFSHVTAGALVIGVMVAVDFGLEPPDDASRSRWRSAAPWIAAGLAAGMAAAVDYLVGVLVLGLVVARVPPSRWKTAVPWMLVGVLPPVLATLAYHDAAFGSPFSLGYDHHANFEFARDRLSTFSGNPLHGLWTQWGAGEGAGVLVLAPVMLVGVAGLALATERRWLLGALPWILLLAAHRTPTGGAAEDHRYLVPLMPVLAVGLGLAWDRLATVPSRRWPVGVALVALAGLSAWLSWSHVRGIWG